MTMALGVLAPALDAYYRNPAVRARIREYCGFEAGRAPSCVFLSAAMPGAPIPSGWGLEPPCPSDTLDDLLDRGADIFRSTWDRDSLLMNMDIDYLDAQWIGHAIAQPADVFGKLEPTFEAIRDILARFDVDLLTLMTGRGCQFTGRVPLTAPLVHRLAALVPDVPDWYDTADRRVPSWISDRLSPTVARAYVGAGLVLEYLAHQIIRIAAPASRLPLVLNGTPVGTGGDGCEAVSLDLSFAGDPLDVRHIRVAFGGYQRHRFRPDLYGHEAAGLDPLVVVPRRRAPLEEMLTRRRTVDGAVRLAESSDATIPVVTDAISRVVDVYAQSDLARFHQRFLTTVLEPPAAWPATYDRLDLSALPPCVAAPLAWPQDLLLRPEYIQHVTRFLLSEGWMPRHIGGLVWSRYAKECGWGDRWISLSPRARAEFDVRVFAGMIATGLDRAIDFNCRSAQDKGICPPPGCWRDLRLHRTRLLTRTS